MQHSSRDEFFLEVVNEALKEDTRLEVSDSRPTDPDPGTMWCFAEVSTESREPLRTESVGMPDYILGAEIELRVFGGVTVPDPQDEAELKLRMGELIHIIESRLRTIDYAAADIEGGRKIEITEYAATKVYRAPIKEKNLAEVLLLGSLIYNDYPVPEQ